MPLSTQSEMVEQLRDYLAAGWQAAPAGTGPATTGLLAALTTEHPLQPFSPRYFSRAPDARPQPDQPPLFTYDSDWRAIHDATDPPAEPTAALPLPLPDWDGRTDVVTLARFLRQPAATFLHGRLKVRFGELDELAEDEPFALDPLATHQLKSRLLEAVRDSGFLTMFEDGVVKAARGETSLSEVFRVIGPVDPETDGLAHSADNELQAV